MAVRRPRAAVLVGWTSALCCSSWAARGSGAGGSRGRGGAASRGGASGLCAAEAALAACAAAASADMPTDAYLDSFEHNAIANEANFWARSGLWLFEAFRGWDFASVAPGTPDYETLAARGAGARYWRDGERRGRRLTLGSGRGIGRLKRSHRLQ